MGSAILGSMTRHAVHLACALLVLASCERKPSTPPDDPANDDGAVAADDAGEDDEPQADDEAGSDKPPPVEQVLEIDGPLPKTAIDTFLQERINEVRDCFDEAMQNPDGLELNGAVVVRFAVGKDGKVSAATVELDEIGYKPSASCIGKVVEGYAFPKQKGESTVHLPFYMNNF